MTTLVTIFVVIGVFVITFGLVMAIGINKDINRRMDNLPTLDGNWTRFKTKGE